MEAAYGRLYDFFGGNEFMINVVGGVAISIVYFWLFNLPFAILDFTRPAWAEKYRVQNDKMPTVEQYLRAVRVALFNQFITGPVVVAFFYFIGNFTGVGYEKNLPSALTVIAHILFAIAIEEIGFYYSHRAFHHPRIYKYVHKIHHEWTSPVSITSIYAHPLEHSLSNLAPILLGPTLLGSHITTVWMWAAVATLSTTFSHCGYHFPFTPSPEQHDWHHRVFNENFGVIGVLDYLHGTSRTFLDSVHYRRHHMYYTLTPIKLLYPDISKSK